MGTVKLSDVIDVILTKAEPAAVVTVNSGSKDATAMMEAVNRFTKLIGVELTLVVKEQDQTAPVDTPATV